MLQEEEKDVGDLDSHRGSFHEFVRLQKVMGQLEDDNNNEGYVTGMNKWNDYQDTDTYGNYMQDISEYHLGPSQDDLTVIKTTSQQRINVLP